MRENTTAPAQREYFGRAGLSIKYCSKLFDGDEYQ